MNEPTPSMRNRRRIPLPLLIAGIAVICLALAAGGFLAARRISSRRQNAEVAEDTDPGWNAPSYVTYKPLFVNEYSRPGTALDAINAVVVHYVGNPGTTAEQNRSYFNGLARSGETWASSHFLIGLDGEVLQNVPLDEVAYCSNERNYDTVSIECCHPEADGKFTDATYSSLVNLLRDLCKEYGLDPKTDIIRHYDVTGKLCPLYFVEHEDEWYGLLDRVDEAIKLSDTASVSP